MRASPIVIGNEFFKGQPQVPLIEREDIVQAFASDGPNQPFAVGVGQGSQLQLMATLPAVVLKSSIHIIR